MFQLLEAVLFYTCKQRIRGRPTQAGMDSVSRESNLVVQDNGQEGIVDVDLAVVLDKAQLPEFVHEKIDPRPRCADHLRQHLLRYFGQHLLRLALLTMLSSLPVPGCYALSFIAAVTEQAVAQGYPRTATTP